MDNHSTDPVREGSPDREAAEEPVPDRVPREQEGEEAAAAAGFHNQTDTLPQAAAGKGEEAAGFHNQIGTLPLRRAAVVAGEEEEEAEGFHNQIDTLPLRQMAVVGEEEEEAEVEDYHNQIHTLPLPQTSQTNQSRPNHPC